MEKQNELNGLRQAKKWAEVEAFSRAELEVNPGDPFYLRALEQSLREQGKDNGLFEIWKVLVDEHGEEYPYTVWIAREEVSREGAETSVLALRRGMESAVQAKDFDAVEELWLELVEAIPAELDYFLHLASELQQRREKSRAGELLQLLLPAWESDHPTPSLLKLIRRIAELQPRDRGVRGEVQRIYRTLYAGRRDLSLLMQQSGLAGDKPLPESIELLETYLPYGADQKVHHSDWGTGVVSRLDPVMGRIVVDFPSKPAHAMDFSLAQRILDPLADDDLRALESAEVERLLKEDPPALVRAAIRSRGGKASGRELKETLLGGAVPEQKWSAWWSRASKQLKTDPKVRVTGGGARVYELREEEIRYEDEVRDRFDAARKVPDKVDVCLDYLSHCKSHSPDRTLLEHLAGGLRKAAGTAKTHAPKVEAAYILERLGDLDRGLDTSAPEGFDALPANRRDAAKIMEGLRFAGHEGRWADRVREAIPEEWPGIFTDLLLFPDVQARDYLAEAVLGLPDGENRLREVFEKTSSAPREYPGCFTWFCERWIEHPEEAARFGQSPVGLLERLFRLLDHLAFAGRRSTGKSGEPVRRCAADIRAFVKKSSFRPVKDALEGPSRVAAESLRNAVVTNTGLDETAKSEVLRIIRTRFPHLAEEEEAGGTGPAPAAESTIMCTRESLEKRKQDLRRISEVEIPENAKEIEEARSHGDLSENAEYKFAKERQSMLHNHALELQDNLRRARPVDLDTVPVDRAGFGTRVTLRGADGGEVSFRILGPWELDYGKDVISYMSDEASAMMGKETGSRVELSTGKVSGEFEIAGIERIADADPSS
jgi:transcription elongation factor GreA-like protein/transcription elongation GreA/GreB family factor